MFQYSPEEGAPTVNRYWREGSDAANAIDLDVVDVNGEGLVIGSRYDGETDSLTTWSWPQAGGAESSPAVGVLNNHGDIAFVESLGREGSFVGRWTEGGGSERFDNPAGFGFCSPTQILDDGRILGNCHDEYVWYYTPALWDADGDADGDAEVLDGYETDCENGVLETAINDIGAVIGHAICPGEGPDTTRLAYVDGEELLLRDPTAVEGLQVAHINNDGHIAAVVRVEGVARPAVLLPD